MAVPAIVASLLLDPIIDSTDLVIDVGNFAIDTYDAYVDTYDWLTDLLNLFFDVITSYRENSKLDRILECNLDEKKFNRLLGRALNYARKVEGLKVIPRNDQEYIDENEETGLPCLDWDGGLPALFNHEHYNFDEFLERFHSNNIDKYYLSDILEANWFGKELKEFPEYGG